MHALVNRMPDIIVLDGGALQMAGPLSESIRGPAVGSEARTRRALWCPAWSSAEEARLCCSVCARFSGFAPRSLRPGVVAGCHEPDRSTAGGFCSTPVRVGFRTTNAAFGRKGAVVQGWREVGAERCSPKQSARGARDWFLFNPVYSRGSTTGSPFRAYKGRVGVERAVDGF